MCGRESDACDSPQGWEAHAFGRVESLRSAPPHKTLRQGPRDETVTAPTTHLVQPQYTSSPRNGTPDPYSDTVARHGTCTHGGTRDPAHTVVHQLSRLKNVFFTLARLPSSSCVCASLRRCARSRYVHDALYTRTFFSEYGHVAFVWSCGRKFLAHLAGSTRIVARRLTGIAARRSEHDPRLPADGSGQTERCVHIGRVVDGLCLRPPLYRQDPQVHTGIDCKGATRNGR